MADHDALIKKYKSQLIKALAHLEYSQRKSARLTPSPDRLSEDELEVWEGFVARFSRATDIFVNKLLRARILRENASFQGTLRDLLNYSEKHGFLSDAMR